MSSPCLTGGGRAYGIDLDLVKSPTRSSSTSSTLSESSNSTPLAISTKRARTRRKRPNQSYTEAAALLAKACPTIFSAKQLSKQCRVAARDSNLYLDSASELLPSFPALSGAGFLLCDPAGESARLELDSPTSCPEFFFGTGFGSYVEDGRKNKIKKNVMEVSQESDSGLKCEILSPGLGFDDEFDTESILDEEVGEGIDSIMGSDCTAGAEEQSEPNDYGLLVDPYLGQLGAVVNVTRALRHVGNGDWWSSPRVEIGKIVPEMKKPTPVLEKNKSKKKKKVEKEKELDVLSTPEKPNRRPSLGLKLDCDGVIKEWLGNGSPFSGELDSSESPADIIGKLSDIDLLSEVAGSGGMRVASVLRYKEKRRSRLFSKKVRYQVRKVNADKRPRTKGRFVKRDDEEEEEHEAALRS